MFEFIRHHSLSVGKTLQHLLPEMIFNEEEGIKLFMRNSFLILIYSFNIIILLFSIQILLSKQIRELC